MEMAHLSEIPNLKPESIAFVSYIINQYVTAPYETIIFEKVDIPFLKARASYVAHYGDEEGKNRLEFWIINIQEMPSGIAVRLVEDGVVNTEHLSFANFVMRPYHQECVIKAIEQLPISV